MQVPAVVTAGDGHAAKTVYGDNKVYLELGNRALVAHVVDVLQHVPEVREVWVVGNQDRLRDLFSQGDIRVALRKPLHIVPQFHNLFENVWETYRRLLPGAGPDGRDPKEDEFDQPVLYLSGDLPFATPQEISRFVRQGLALDCDYAMGIVKDESLRDFRPSESGEPGIQLAYFNLREGRFRQSNLHLAKPPRVLNRHYIEQMYEHRHQREFWHVLRLAWNLLRHEQGGLRILLFYVLLHLAGVANRRGLHGLADYFRRFVSLVRVERAIGAMLRTDFRFAITEAGGCAVDIDHEEEFDAAAARFDEWVAAQTERAERLYGPLPLPSGEGA